MLEGKTPLLIALILAALAGGIAWAAINARHAALSDPIGCVQVCFPHDTAYSTDGFCVCDMTREVRKRL